MVKINKQDLGYDLLLGNVYIPPDNTSYCKGDEFEILFSQLVELNAKLSYEVCLVGDYNSRTGTLKDFISIDDSVAKVAALHKNNDIFLSDQILVEISIDVNRSNKDKKSNPKGEKMLDFCKSSGLLIVNGRVGRDRFVGKATCEKEVKNGITNSTIDHALATHTLFRNISDFHVDILDKTTSDVHCPISLTFN